MGFAPGFTAIHEILGPALPGHYQKSYRVLDPFCTRFDQVSSLMHPYLESPEKY
jgi:hypothetical protein